MSGLSPVTHGNGGNNRDPCENEEVATRKRWKRYTWHRVVCIASEGICDGQTQCTREPLMLKVEKKRITIYKKREWGNEDDDGMKDELEIISFVTFVSSFARFVRKSKRKRKKKEKTQQNYKYSFNSPYTDRLTLYASCRLTNTHDVRHVDLRICAQNTTNIGWKKKYLFISVLASFLRFLQVFTMSALRFVLPATCVSASSVEGNDKRCTFEFPVSQHMRFRFGPMLRTNVPRIYY